jgi:hypothetical protein
MSKRLVFEVTQEDIDKGCSSSCECPITRGILRALGLSLNANIMGGSAEAMVKTDSLEIYIQGERYNTTNRIHDFVVAYDMQGRDRVKPGRFALPLR